LKSIVAVAEGLAQAVEPLGINQFVRFTAHDADCSSGYAQKLLLITSRPLMSRKAFSRLTLITSIFCVFSLKMMCASI
jgi:hypothetical protein